MGKQTYVPEMKDYLVFRYNLYMFEYMYECIVDRIVKRYPMNNNQMLQAAFGKERKKFLYSMLNTNRTDYSKYMHDTKEEKSVTKPVRTVFNEYPRLVPFITGERLVIDRVGKEEYPNEHTLELSEETQNEIEKLVDKAFEYLKDDVSYERLEGKGLIVELTGWMIIQVTKGYEKLKDKESSVDNIIFRKIQEIDDISFEMLDACEMDTLKELQDATKKMHTKLAAILNYKSLKSKKK